MQGTITPVYVTFLNYNDELECEPITRGPYPFVQVTYEWLRHGEDGEDVAWYLDGYWYVKGERADGLDKIGPYSDFVVSTIDGEE